MKPTTRVLLGVAGLRPPASHVTPAELELLLRFARGARSVVEVGVSEGATSARLLEAMSPAGRLYLVDPYLERLRLESWLGISLTAAIARRAVRRYGDRARFVRATSIDGALELQLDEPPSLIFLDARHDHEPVSEDLRAWAPRLAEGGVIAVHDAVPCASRPALRSAEGACRAVEEARSSGWDLVASAESLAVLRTPAHR